MTTLRKFLVGALFLSLSGLGNAYLYVPPPTGLPPSGAAGGDLSGTFPDPAIAAGAVTSDKIADTTITGGDIAAGTVTLANQVNAAANSIRGNNTGSPATPLDLTVAQVRAMIPIASATFTPTTGTSTNCNAATGNAQTMYTRVNDIVTVSGLITLDPTLIATQTTCLMSLPIASNLATNNDLGGTICAVGSADCGSLFGDATGDQVIIRWTPGLSAASQLYSFMYQYQIK